MEGREEGKGLRLLEQMLHSDTFKRAQKVSSVLPFHLHPTFILRVNVMLW